MSTTPKRLGKYELQERLGHGGVAEVWKALDTQLQRFVAIKLLHPDLRDDPNFIHRFEREAQLIASLHHPNIVQIHDFQIYEPSASEQDENAPIAYMVMDYVEGQTLATYMHTLSSEGKFPTPNEIVNLFTSISHAIDYAHQKGMIHRDIKPANILLDHGNTIHNPMGEPILTDFGVAKLLSASTNTLSGAQLGTPLYISPEQAKGYPGNERSDIYSLGVILYEILTGITPFRGDTAIDVITQHINATPTSPSLINPAIPPTLTLVIMRSLAKDPSARFSSAAAMTAAIAEAFNLPIPESLDRPAYPSASVDMPTQFSSLTPSSQPVSSGAQQVAAASGSSNPPSQPGISGPYSQPGISTPGYSGPYSQPGSSNPSPNFTPVMVYATQTPPVPPPSPVRNKRRTGLYIALTAIVLLLLIGGGLFTYFSHKTASPPPPVAATAGGSAFYISSGQLNSGSAQGIADGLQVDLKNIPAPQAGNSYYLWLLADKHPEPGPDLLGGVATRPVKPPLLLTNNLPVQNGAVHYRYTGDANHNNLISATSRLLITEEQSGKTPSAPSTDRATWRYYAEIPQTQIPGAAPGFSALVHIRHLFYNETNIRALGLPGGLDIWLFRDTEKLVEFATSARDDWHAQATNASDVGLMRDHFVRIIDLLDGSANLKTDLPPGTPLIADPTMSRVGLITVNADFQSAHLDVDPPGYVDHIQLHVGQVAKATDITPQMRNTTAHILDSVNRAKVWLLNARADALKLSKIMNNLAQMQQPSTGALLDDLVTQVTYAYIGQLNPVTNKVEGGVLQAHYDIQQLAAFTITRNLPQQL